ALARPSRRMRPVNSNQRGMQRPQRLRNHPRPQPPATSVTMSALCAAVAIAAPLAGAADAAHSPRAPTPAAMMTAARIARISCLLCSTETLGRAHLRRTGAALPMRGAVRMRAMRCCGGLQALLEKRTVARGSNHRPHPEERRRRRRVSKDGKRERPRLLPSFETLASLAPQDEAQIFYTYLA